MSIVGIFSFLPKKLLRFGFFFDIVLFVDEMGG